MLKIVDDVGEDADGFAQTDDLLVFALDSDSEIIDTIHLHLYVLIDIPTLQLDGQAHQFIGLFDFIPVLGLRLPQLLFYFMYSFLKILLLLP